MQAWLRAAMQSLGGRTSFYQEGRDAQKSRDREPPVTDCLHVTRAWCCAARGSSCHFIHDSIHTFSYSLLHITGFAKFPRNWQPHGPELGSLAVVMSAELLLPPFGGSFQGV